MLEIENWIFVSIKTTENLEKKNLEQKWAMCFLLDTFPAVHRLNVKILF